MQLEKLRKVLARHNMHSCLISRGDVRLFTYYKDGKEHSLETLNSISKSILALAVGKAIEKNLFTLHTKVGDLISSAHISVRSSTVEELLLMKSGYREKDWREISSTENWSNNLYQIEASEKRMSYSNTDSYLLSLILAEVLSKDWTYFLEEEILHPLGIKNYCWEKSPEGVPIGGYGMHLRAADLLKLSSMIISGGAYKGKQLINEEYIQSMLTPGVENALRGQDYGYHWWIESNYPALNYAAGSKGKFMFLVPEKDVTAVFLGELTEKELLPFQWFRKYVLT